jgi:hypothetical protein
MAAERESEATELLKQVVGRAASRQAGATARGLLAAMHFQAGRPETGMKVMEELTKDKQTPRASLPFELIASVFNYQEQNGPLAGDIAFLDYEFETRGDWIGRYGREFHFLAGMTAPFSITGGRLKDVRVVGYTGDPEDTKGVRAWLGSASTTDPRALLNPLLAPGGRTYSCHDDHGEALYPFADGGPDLFYDINIPAGEHLLSLYVVDFDWWQHEQPRQQSTLVTDPDGAVLAAALTPAMPRGVYQRFAAKGPCQLTIRVQKHDGICAVLSGMFMDPLPRLVDFPKPVTSPMEKGDKEDWADWARTASPEAYALVDRCFGPSHSKSTDGLKEYVKWFRQDVPNLYQKLSEMAADSSSSGRCAVGHWFLAQVEALGGRPSGAAAALEAFVSPFEIGTDPDPYRVRTLERLAEAIEPFLPSEGCDALLKRRVLCVGPAEDPQTRLELVKLAAKDLARGRVSMARCAFDASRTLWQGKPMPFDARVFEVRLLQAEKRLSEARKAAKALVEEQFSAMHTPTLNGEADKPDERTSREASLRTLLTDLLSLTGSTGGSLEEMEDLVTSLRTLCDKKSPLPRLALAQLALTAVARNELIRAREYADQLRNEFGKCPTWRTVEEAIKKASTTSPNWPMELDN